ncbi:asparagine synthase C-terminal domain-containing protein [Methanosphaerula subterraneus]|uniref:asparagine synthase C-terminal domain-containing protein n=1 Tax=Methanosphaerula subterraneus TaxID=3350244 RepID=UPI003F8463E0
MTAIDVKGWVERDGHRLSQDEIETLISTGPDHLSHCGGEFLIRWDDCAARDRWGIIQGDVDAGTVTCDGTVISRIDPPAESPSLEEAIVTAIRLRSDEGVTALSGGVDSTLIAAIAERPCVAVGVEDSHDLARARHAAEALHLTCDYVTITPDAVEEALAAVIPVIPARDPVNISIAATMHFVASYARDHGYTRILAGQGADELFGGYSRYLTSTDLAATFAEDFRGLALQGARDQAVAGLFGAYLSMPYLDVRVVRAAQAISPNERVSGGIRKRPLREVAARYIPAEIADYDKKAMQYGTGVWKVIRHLARHNGYNRSVQGYLNHVGSLHDGA